MDANGSIRCVERVVARKRVSCLVAVFTVLFVLTSGCDGQCRSPSLLDADEEQADDAV